MKILLLVFMITLFASSSLAGDKPDAAMKLLLSRGTSLAKNKLDTATIAVKPESVFCTKDQKVLIKVPYDKAGKDGRRKVYIITEQHPGQLTPTVVSFRRHPTDNSMIAMIVYNDRYKDGLLNDYPQDEAAWVPVTEC